MTADERLFNESYLRRLERLALVFNRAAASQMQGERRSSRRGQSVEFADFRPYALGDDFRRIDWNAYARLEKLFIKLFVEEQEITIRLLIDNSPSMDWGQPNKLDYAIRAAASIGYIGLVNLDRVSAYALFSSNQRSHYLKPVRGKRSALSLFNYLQSIEPATIGQTGANPIGNLIFNEPGIVFIFSDLMGDNWLNAVNHFRSHGQDVSLLHILSPDEANPNLSGDFLLVDRENHAEIEITADFETLRRYRENLESWQDQWQKYCTARNISYTPVITSLDIEELLFAQIPAQGILR